MGFNSFSPSQSCTVLYNWLWARLFLHSSEHLAKATDDCGFQLWPTQVYKRQNGSNNNGKTVNLMWLSCSGATLYSLGTAVCISSGRILRFEGNVRKVCSRIKFHYNIYIWKFPVHHLNQNKTRQNQKPHTLAWRGAFKGENNHRTENHQHSKKEKKEREMRYCAREKVSKCSIADSIIIFFIFIYHSKRIRSHYLLPILHYSVPKLILPIVRNVYGGV